MSHTAQAPTFPGGGEILLVQRTYRDPGEGELLISPRANAICGTDRGMFLGGAGHVLAGGETMTTDEPYRWLDAIANRRDR